MLPHSDPLSAVLLGSMYVFNGVWSGAATAPEQLASLSSHTLVVIDVMFVVVIANNNSIIIAITTFKIVITEVLFLMVNFIHLIVMSCVILTT
jgi:hypothetical protein